MKGSLPRIRAALLAVAALAACSSATQPILTPAAQAKADGGRPPYTRADVHFMSGMISHHAQAVLMAGWAPTHGAGESVRALAERIVVGQRDEIALMQTWLRDRNETVPDGDASHDVMAGMDHWRLMPGMLTADQLAQLNKARGLEFDHLFLTFMIQHHQGAVTMVEQLFGAYGAAQDDNVFKFASDVHVDQITEIERMTLMLAALANPEKSP
jgi:uncharacterized protein (DUF305 family)